MCLSFIGTFTLHTLDTRTIWRVVPNHKMDEAEACDMWQPFEDRVEHLAVQRPIALLQNTPRWIAFWLPAPCRSSVSKSTRLCARSGIAAVSHYGLWLKAITLDNEFIRCSIWLAQTFVFKFLPPSSTFLFFSVTFDFFYTHFASAIYSLSTLRSLCLPPNQSSHVLSCFIKLSTLMLLFLFVCAFVQLSSICTRSHNSYLLAQAKTTSSLSFYLKNKRSFTTTQKSKRYHPLLMGNRFLFPTPD